MQALWPQDEYGIALTSTPMTDGGAPPLVTPAAHYPYPAYHSNLLYQDPAVVQHGHQTTGMYVNPEGHMAPLYGPGAYWTPLPQHPDTDVRPAHGDNYSERGEIEGAKDDDEIQCQGNVQHNDYDSGQYDRGHPEYQYDEGSDNNCKGAFHEVISAESDGQKQKEFHSESPGYLRDPPTQGTETGGMDKYRVMYKGGQERPNDETNTAMETCSAARGMDSLQQDFLNQGMVS